MTSGNSPTDDRERRRRLAEKDAAIYAAMAAAGESDPEVGAAAEKAARLMRQMP